MLGNKEENSKKTQQEGRLPNYVDELRTRGKRGERIVKITVSSRDTGITEMKRINSNE